MVTKSKNMLAHKEIEKHLKKVGIEYTSYETYRNGEYNPSHVVAINLRDGKRVCFETKFNYRATEVFNELRYHLVISDGEMPLYTNNNINLENILNKLKKYENAM